MISTTPFRTLLLLLLLLVPGAIRAQDTETEADTETATSTGTSAEAEDLDLLRELLQQGDYGEANEAVEEMVEEGIGGVELALLRARLLRETGRGAEGLAVLTAAPEYAAGDARVRVAAAGLRYESGDRQGAEEELRHALETDADSVEAITRLGLLLIDNGKRAAGEKQLQKIVGLYERMSPAEARKADPHTFVWMGRALEGLNRIDEAFNVMYDSALTIDDRCIEAYLASGEICLAKYNYPDARSFLGPVLKKPPPPSALAINPNCAEAHILYAYATYVDYGFPRDLGNRFAVTLRHLKKADRIWKDHPDALVLRGHLALYEGSEEAEDYYRRAAAVDPGNLERQGHLATYLFALARLEEFEALCSEVEKRHPAPAAFYGTLAAGIVDHFFYREAAQYAAKAIQLDPQYWPAYVTRGINAARIGRQEEARKWVQRAFEKDRYNIRASNTLKLFRYMDKNFTEVKTDDFIYRMSRDDMPFIHPYLAPLMEETRQRLETQYQMDVGDTVTIEDFSDHRYFSARSVGLPGLSASGVCFGIFVTLTTPKAIPGNWGAIAVHELAHVITVTKTGHRIPRWFTEGLSVFEEGRHDPKWRRIYAVPFVDAVHHNDLLPIEQLPAGFTKPDGPQRILLSYFQGGMICRYVDKQWGFEKIVAMLNAYRIGKATPQVLQEVLGVSTSQFDDGFFAFCREQAEATGIWTRYTRKDIQPTRFHLEDHPDDIDAWVKLGFAYYFTRKLADAELVIGKALKLDREHAELAALRGFVEMRQRKWKSAAGNLEKAIARGSHYQFRCRVLLAAARQKLGDKQGAIAPLREALDIHPDAIRPFWGKRNPYWQLADLLRAEGQEAEAVEVLERLARTDRDDLEVRKILGSHYRAQEEWGKVVLFLGDAPYIDPYDIEVHQMLADAYMNTKVYRSALRELTVLLAYEKPSYDRIYPDVARCHLELGDREKAEEFARRALEVAPNSKKAQQVLDELAKPSEPENL